MEFNQQYDARYTVERCDEKTMRRVFIGGTDILNEAKFFIMGLEHLPDMHYAVYDRDTQRMVYRSPELPKEDNWASF